MHIYNKPIPRVKAPMLEVPTAQGTKWNLNNSNALNFTVIIIYRGLHCPICSTYLKDIEDNFDRFNNLGVELIAISTDKKDRAIKTLSEWNLNKLLIGYDLSKEVALLWGLHLSSGRENPSLTTPEPDIFVEPGLFIIKNDGSLYMSSIQTMPFGRPPINEIIGGISYAIKNNYPARGEIID
ncbi:redoxin domain-containing protein [Alphaproteobacteria bacterium]|nr:redoxin domain-containing protein [Alphaproteobacteria bacterium]